jgi:hypothetical protein
VLLKQEFGSQRDEFVLLFARSKRAMCPASISLYEARNGVCQSARLKGVEDAVLRGAITSTRSAVTYVLRARNQTQPRGFFLPGRSFVTVRQAEDCSGAVRRFFFAESSRLRLETSIKRSEE